jgi:hypothetical protein
VLSLAWKTTRQPSCGPLANAAAASCPGNCSAGQPVCAPSASSVTDRKDLCSLFRAKHREPFHDRRHVVFRRAIEALRQTATLTAADRARRGERVTADFQRQISSGVGLARPSWYAHAASVMLARSLVSLLCRRRNRRHQGPAEKLDRDHAERGAPTRQHRDDEPDHSLLPCDPARGREGARRAPRASDAFLGVPVATT